MVKQLRQVAGVESVKAVDFKKGIFAVTPQRGVRLSEAALLAAARRSGFEPDRVVAPRGTSKQKPSERPKPGRPDERAAEQVSKELAPARAAFRKGDYDQALKLASQVAEKPRPALDVKQSKDAKQNARDAEVRQFLALVYFTLGKFDEAATAARAALHRGPQWKWETLRKHYVKTNDYTSHLRVLEQSIREKPTADKRFLIGYHYLMLGHAEAARAQLSRAAQQNPKDELLRSLLGKLAKGESP